jgi:flagellar hook assembly protein FlgD
VWKDEKTVSAGPNAFLWNGRDRGGDRVANGVYLVQLEARPTGGGAAAKHLERVVVLR